MKLWTKTLVTIGILLGACSGQDHRAATAAWSHSECIEAERHAMTADQVLGADIYLGNTERDVVVTVASALPDWYIGRVFVHAGTEPMPIPTDGVDPDALPYQSSPDWDHAQTHTMTVSLLDCAGTLKCPLHLEMAVAVELLRFEEGQVVSERIAWALGDDSFPSVLGGVIHYDVCCPDHDHPDAGMADAGSPDAGMADAGDGGHDHDGPCDGDDDESCDDEPCEDDDDVCDDVEEPGDDDPGDEVCTRTQGYWKTHHAHAGHAPLQVDWPAPEDEDAMLCGQRWLDVLHTAPKGGDAWIILAHQYMAAALNLAAGAGADADVEDAVDQAADMLASHCDGIDKGTEARQDALQLAGELDEYNNGDDCD